MKFNSPQFLTLIRVGIIITIFTLLININSHTRKNTIYLNSIDQSLEVIIDILEKQTEHTNYNY